MITSFEKGRLYRFVGDRDATYIMPEMRKITDGRPHLCLAQGEVIRGFSVVGLEGVSGTHVWDTRDFELVHMRRFRKGAHYVYLGENPTDVPKYVENAFSGRILTCVGVLRPMARLSGESSDKFSHAGFSDVVRGEVLDWEKYFAGFREVRVE